MKIDGGIASAAAPKPFAPALHELAHQLPLRAARVLELVHQHVAMTRLEPETALGELVHLLEQLDGALEHAGEIEQRVRIERVLVLPQRDREDPPDAARHHRVEIAPEGADGRVHGRREPKGGRAVTLPGVRRVAVVGGEAGAGELLAARLPFLGQEVGAKPIDEVAERRLIRTTEVVRHFSPGCSRFGSRAAASRPTWLLRYFLADSLLTLPLRLAPSLPVWRTTLVGVLHEPAKVVRQHRELRVMARAVVEKRLEAAATLGEDLAQPCGGRLAGAGGRQIARSLLQKPAQRVRRDEPAIEQRRDAGAQAPLAELREHQRHIVVVARDAAADPQRLVERLADQARHLGLVGEIEAGIDVGLERELAQQRQTERVDRRDRDVAEPLLQIAPASGVELRQAARLLQPIDDALPHLGGGLARERDREDVIRLDAGAQQVDVALDEHARLAGAGRRLEDDVLRRIDGVGAGRPDRAGRDQRPAARDRRLATADPRLPRRRRTAAAG